MITNPITYVKKKQIVSDMFLRNPLLPDVPQIVRLPKILIFI